MKTDQELLTAYSQGGDREALDELFERHREAGFRAARRILGNDSDALDATQSACLNGFRRLDSLREGSRFGGWFRRIVVNEALGIKRSRSAQRPSLDADPPRVPRHSEAAPGADEIRILQGAIDDLPEDYRIPILLHYCDGLSYDEIAQALDWPRGTVGTNIHRGMERLRVSLASTGLSVAALLRTLGAPPEPPPAPDDSMLA